MSLEPSVDKQERLLRACKATIAERGVHKATIAEVARAAAITPGLVHYYFPSKQALVYALFDQLAADFTTRLRSTDDPALRIVGFVDAALALGEHADPEGVRVWVWLSAEALRDAPLRERWQAVIAAFVEELTTAFGALSVREPREAAGAVVSGVLGAWQIGTIAPDALPPGSAANTQRRFVEALLKLEAP